MRVLIIIAAMFFFIKSASAQTDVKPMQNSGTPAKRGTVNICTVSRRRLLNRPPLYVVYVENKLIYRSDTAKTSAHTPEDSVRKANPLSLIPQEAIQSMNILKDSTATQRFGTAGMWGVIEIYLDDKNHPDAYKVFSKTVTGKQR